MFNSEQNEILYNGEHFDNVIILIIENSSIEKIPSNLFRSNGMFENLLELKMNNVSLAALNTVDFTNANELQKLSLAFNRITELPVNVFHLAPHLIEINLSFNKITEIHVNAFNGNLNIKSLILNNNRLHYLCSVCFQLLKHLDNLDLSNNLIGPTVDGNGFFIDGEIFEKPAITIKLNNNSIKNVVNFTSDDDNLMRFKVFDLSHNLFLHSEPVNVSAETLIYNTAASGFCVIDTRVNVIKAENNEIKEILIVNPDISKITELHLSNNLLTSARNLSYLFELEILDLSLNRIKSWVHYTSLPKLRTLNLAHNRLKRIDLFEHRWLTPNLKDLYLNGNRLPSLDVNAIKISAPELNNIYLAHNSWMCNYLRVVFMDLLFVQINLQVHPNDLYTGDYNINGILCQRINSNDDKPDLYVYNATNQNLLYTSKMDKDEISEIKREIFDELKTHFEKKLEMNVNCNCSYQNKTEF